MCHNASPLHNLPSTITQSQPLLPDGCMSMWSVRCSFPAFQSCTTPVEVGLLCALSSLSFILLLLQQLTPAHPPATAWISCYFHPSYRSRPVELCPVSGISWLCAETLSLFDSFSPSCLITDSHEAA